MFAFVCRRTGDVDRAADLTAETNVAVAAGRPDVVAARFTDAAGVTRTVDRRRAPRPG